MIARARLLMGNPSLPYNRIRLLLLILPMRIPQQPLLMSRVKGMPHLNLKMRSLHFHTQIWQSWMT